MKKFFAEPELEFITYHSEDVIVTSGCAGFNADEGQTSEGFDD